jgi:glycosyltransferase involved in cell wall biosynthesis
MLVSIVIPCYNGAATIGQCLRSLVEQNYSGAYEIILVDSSDDETPEIVKRDFPFVRLIRLREKTDPGEARTVGIKLAEGALVHFIDADCVADPAWMEKTILRHEEGYPVVGGSVENGNRPGDPVALAGYLAEFREFIPEQAEGQVNHVPACNISYKKEIFDIYGSFGGKYYPQEDMLYNYSLRKRGLPIFFDPVIKVRHFHRTGFRDFLRHQRKIGAVTPAVIIECGLPGAWLARRPFLAVLASPFLPAVKFINTLFVFLRRRPSTVLKNPAAVVVLAAGLSAWMIGFIQGTLKVIQTKESGQ